MRNWAERELVKRCKEWSDVFFCWTSKLLKTLLKRAFGFVLSTQRPPNQRSSCKFPKEICLLVGAWRRGVFPRFCCLMLGFRIMGPGMSFLVFLRFLNAKVPEVFDKPWVKNIQTPWWHRPIWKYFLRSLVEIRCDLFSWLALVGATHLLLPLLLLLHTCLLSENL